jgi:hypothetical protein
VAFLRLDAENLTAAELGDSDKARVGQFVLAFGSPFGLNQTVTHGIISARERGQVSLGSTIRIKDFLQTDAAINPGSSGGPLLNLDGEVIGINTAIASQSGSASGVAFAIPINLVKRIVQQLQERGSVSRGYLGLVLAQSFEPADAVKLGLDRARGAKVESVYPGTPAELAGVRVNDVVLSIDGSAIRNDNHLINMISMLPAGQRVKRSSFNRLAAVQCHRFASRRWLRQIETIHSRHRLGWSAWTCNNTQTFGRLRFCGLSNRAGTARSPCCAACRLCGPSRRIARAAFSFHRRRS